MYLQIAGCVLENFFIIMEKIMWTWHRVENKSEDSLVFSLGRACLHIFYIWKYPRRSLIIDIKAIRHLNSLKLVLDFKEMESFGIHV